MSETRPHVAWRAQGSRAWAVDTLSAFLDIIRQHPVTAAKDFASREEALAWVERMGDHWLEEQGADVAALKQAGHPRTGR